MFEKLIGRVFILFLVFSVAGLLTWLLDLGPLGFFVAGVAVLVVFEILAHLIW